MSHGCTFGCEELVCSPLSLLLICLLLVKVQRFAFWCQRVSVFLGKRQGRSLGEGLSLARLGRVSLRGSSVGRYLNNGGGADARGMCWSDDHILWNLDIKRTGTGVLIHGMEHSSTPRRDSSSKGEGLFEWIAWLVLTYWLSKSSSEVQRANCFPYVGFAPGGATLGGSPFVPSKVCVPETLAWVCSL